MISQNSVHAYGKQIRNNAAKLIDDLGREDVLPLELQAAVVIAQSNLAIAASIVEAAVIIADTPR